jgi:hypothetical protein
MNNPVLQFNEFLLEERYKEKLVAVTGTAAVFCLVGMM